MSVEINCTQCGMEALLTRESVYKGLMKVGETLSCSACGFVFSAEQKVPFKKKKEAPVVFTEADRSEKIKIFAEDEHRFLCRYCAEYVLNPFMQFCSYHKKEVQATDSCEQFTPAAGNAPPSL